MKRRLPPILILTASLLLLSPALAADDLEKLAGVWNVSKTNDQGQAYTQTVEIEKDKLKFKITGDDGNTYFVATGDLKAEKCGVLNVLKITGIKAGSNESELNPVDDDRTLVYQLSGNTWTVASNFDRERDEKPGIDVYRKTSK